MGVEENSLGEMMQRTKDKEKSMEGYKQNKKERQNGKREIKSNIETEYMNLSLLLQSSYELDTTVDWSLKT